MERTVTVEQMKYAEKNAVEMGISYAQLMDNAGTLSALNIAQKYYVINKKAVVLCGSGNNGGDGFVIAKRLIEKGASVTVVMCKGMPTTDESNQMYEALLKEEAEILWLDKDKRVILYVIKQADFIVDCLFGTGFKGQIQEPILEIVNEVNRSPAKVISIDIPSGLCGDGNLQNGTYIHADLTLALGAYKTVHTSAQAKDCCGEIILVDIGIPEKAFLNTESIAKKITLDTVKNILPKRDEYSHKGNYGRLLNIAGSVGMGGAAIMSTMSALRSGAGIVCLASVREVINFGFPFIMEATTLPLNSDQNGQIAKDSFPALLTALNKASACVIGCGLGQGDTIKTLTRLIIANSKNPVVIDADGINALAHDIDIIKTANCDIVITPHPMEMSRLTGLSVEHIVKNREKAALEFAKEYGVTVILKGHDSVVATKDGEIFINTTGNAGMARGGSGDVLSGMLGAFLAQGIDCVKASILGVYLHGLAGDEAAKKLSQEGMLPRDMIEQLPLLFNLLD